MKQERHVVCEARDFSMADQKKKRSQGIAAWPQDDRPRERLLRQGAQTLTDAELVAILLRVGLQGASAMELALQPP